MPADVEPTYRIGEVTAQTTLSRDTLRYYERLGLLDHPPRTSGGFRMYDEATLERLRFIKRAQAGGFSHWFLLWLFPLFIVFFISGVAETNRAPFDVAEGESEIVAGFLVEYSGVCFVLFFLAEYANIILISALTSIFFFGGYASFFAGWTFLEGGMFAWLMAPAFGWLALKISFFIFVFFWLRATFPRYRYDQIMRLGWKVFIPVTIIWIAVEGVLAYLQVGPWSNLTG